MALARCTNLSTVQSLTVNKHLGGVAGRVDATADGSFKAVNTAPQSATVIHTRVRRLIIWASVGGRKSVWVCGCIVARNTHVFKCVCVCVSVGVCMCCCYIWPCYTWIKLSPYPPLLSSPPLSFPFLSPLLLSSLHP